MTQDAATADNSAASKPKNKEPYQQAYYPPVPTGFTRFMRSNLVWQFWRFLVINLKIFKLMFRSHH
ncbi:MAG: hypothetical protein GVY22_07665 [Gammaproteobacteria bacterium]|jgi:hypothetical protein|nr:hypothetical protein [Gammaproteobacteria bacterium]